MNFFEKFLLLQMILVGSLLGHLNAAHALKLQGSKDVQFELTQWLKENDISPNLSVTEKDQRREFIFKLRLKTHNKDSILGHKSLMLDFQKSSDLWEHTLGDLLDTELERGESLISFLKDYVTLVPQGDEIIEHVKKFKNSRLYFDGEKMQEAHPQNFEEAGQTADLFLRQKEDRALPEWYRLDLIAPLKLRETAPEASETL